jgi:prepilin-type N-terminal cleavage/methylation domain-containing protein
MRRNPGFTLIELLIVVAIIAILAAIAVPNFLEAQVRAKVSRAKADMRSIVTALESYVVDNNVYPEREGNPIKIGIAYSRITLPLLSTPIAYLSTGLLIDPFAVGSIETRFFGYANNRAAVTDGPTLATIGLASKSPEDLGNFASQGFTLQSVGPDRVNFALTGTAPPFQFPQAFNDLVNTPTSPRTGDFFYDPTNGTISGGDIVRTNKVQN